MPLNVLGSELDRCSCEPRTGFFRDGYCHACADDAGMHTICAIMTEEFLLFSRSRGNDLLTPLPQYQFPGLSVGDRWCLCLQRWQEAQQAGYAPPVVLESTHISVTEFIDLAILQQYATP